MFSCNKELSLLLTFSVFVKRKAFIGESFFLTMVWRVQALHEASSLLSSLKHNIHRRIQQSPERTEIDLLLDNLHVYAKRVKGQPLSEEDHQVQPHRYFDGMVVVPRQRTYNSLLRRLKVMLRFNITSYEKITRDLLTGLFQEEVERLTGREIRLLTLLYNNPQDPQTKIAKELNISLPTLRKDVRCLEEKIGLRFANLVDWGRFKLKHYSLFFITHGVDASRELERVFKEEMSTYLTTAVFDTTQLRGFAAFRIPDQNKPVRLFQRQLDLLHNRFFEVAQVHEIKRYYQSICFDHFDYDTSTWLIEGDVTTLGLLNFVRENWNILPKPRGCSNTKDRSFDLLDYYLASFLVGDGRAPMKKIMERLSSVEIHAPRTTVSTRKSRLFEEGTLEPYFVYTTPQLPFFISFAIKCDPAIAEQIIVGVAQMPLTFAFTSNIGCVVHVTVPSRSLGPILNILSLTREEPGVEEVWQMQQFSNLGSVDPAQIASKWNGNYWNWDEEEFSIPSL